MILHNDKNINLQLVEGLPCEYMPDPFKNSFKNIYGQLLALHVEISDIGMSLSVEHDVNKTYCGISYHDLKPGENTIPLDSALFVEYAYNIARAVKCHQWGYIPLLCTDQSAWAEFKPVIYITDECVRDYNEGTSKVLGPEFTDLYETLKPGSELGDWLIKASKRSW